jgi:NADH-quinone oxidoreductase subunit F
MGGTGELNNGEPIDMPPAVDADVSEPHMRFPTAELPPDERRNDFREVACGYRKLDAMSESLRCLHCDRR